jgi:hypothetical protein
MSHDTPREPSEAMIEAGLAAARKVGLNDAPVCIIYLAMEAAKDRETASPASEDVVERLAKLLNSHFGVGNSEHWPVYTQNARDILAAFPLTSPTPRDMLDGNRALPFDREALGRMVRDAWVRWAETQPSPKASWLVPYDELEEPDKEADRQIGEAVARWTLIGDAALAALKDTQQPSRDHKKAPQGRCGKCLERLRNCTCFPQPDRETDREALLRLLLALQERRVKHIRTEYERGWNYGLEEAEDVIKRIAEGMKGHE